MTKNNTTNYIIFGASGDLARRYLLPAIENLQEKNEIGSVVLVSRKDYENLKTIITGDEEKIFHLAVPPAGVAYAIELISKSFGREKIKIMLEKPFGQDLKSAEALIEHIDKYFSENQIYRIDHYLAKQSLQNIIGEEFDKKEITKIEIIASEKIDIEGRANFYEQTGALKDFVQSHLLEMAAVFLSGSFEIQKRHEALKNLQIVCDISRHECVKRGQYAGYREEVDNEKSMTETFVSINLISNDPVWHGVPIVLCTGKAFAQKFTEIRIKYKNGEEKIFKIEHEPDTYERVMQEAIEGKHDLFVSSGEILETWRILDEIQKTWDKNGVDLVIYEKGITIEEIMNVI
jgi:glucose-6-phosphate 1-dehydrogenase